MQLEKAALSLNQRSLSCSSEWGQMQGHMAVQDAENKASRGFTPKKTFIASP